MRHFFIYGYKRPYGTLIECMYVYMLIYTRTTKYQIYLNTCKFCLGFLLKKINFCLGFEPISLSLYIYTKLVNLNYRLFRKSYGQILCVNRIVRKTDWLLYSFLGPKTLFKWKIRMVPEKKTYVISQFHTRKLVDVSHITFSFLCIFVYKQC